MWLQDIEADRLRNLKAVSLGLPSGLTIIVGRNGQGKSSLLEAIYLLATGRSFRTRRQDELVSWNGGPLRVAGTTDGLRGNSKLGVLIDRGERRLLLNNGEKELEDYIGRLDVVDLSGERMKVLRGAPEERRRFLDRGVVGIDAGFLRLLGRYRRALHQRNALLRSGGASQAAQLDAWDEHLVPAATAVHRRRREYAVQLAASLGEIRRALFPEKGELRLRYRPSPAAAGEVGPEEFAGRYAEALAAGRPRDLQLGHTGVGPHRDDLSIELDEVDLRKFGSAGQVRAGMIALKFGKLHLLQEDRREAPLFLMDDFDTDLDETKAAALADFLHHGGFQAVVATSKETLADQISVSSLKVRMDDGAAEAA